MFFGQLVLLMTLFESFLKTIVKLRFSGILPIVLWRKKIYIYLRRVKDISKFYRKLKNGSKTSCLKINFFITIIYNNVCKYMQVYIIYSQLNEYIKLYFICSTVINANISTKQKHSPTKKMYYLIVYVLSYYCKMYYLQ